MRNHSSESDTIRRAVLDRLAELGWTVNKLCVFLHGEIPRSSIYDWINGVHDMQQSRAAHILDKLGLEVKTKLAEDIVQMYIDDVTL